MKSQLLFTIILLIISLSINAEITTDGTLGSSAHLPGPDYQIGADLGQQHGGNLFHSFQDFNLNSSESATFSGSNNVSNVISRVTGGNPSNIDGLIRSTIPNADMYFLNPNGIMFGPNAQLDVQGSFHASTADYLRLGENGRFDARNPSESILTVAPITAFGFLTDPPATITTQDSTLSVLPMKTLSLIGGDLHLNGTLPVQFDDNNIYATFTNSLLHTAGGQINLAAMGSSGEVLVNKLDLTLTGRGGDITLNNTLVDTSGLGSGNLKVRGNRLLMQDSTLQANTLGEVNAGIMDIQLMESLHADSTAFLFTAFASKALGGAHAGVIAIKVPELTLNHVGIQTHTLTEGNAGNIEVDVTRLNLLAGANIAAASFGSGKSGEIAIKASESVLLSGHSVGSHIHNGQILTDMPSFIDNSALDTLGSGEINLTTQRLDLVGGIISSVSFGKGKAGDIVIQADNINMTAGAIMTTTALDTGLAGNIQLEVEDTLFLSGRRAGTFIAPITGTRFDNNQSNITSFSMTGSGGKLDLRGKTIHLTQEAFISASSIGLADKTSHINLQAENLHLMEGAQINSSNGFYGGMTFFLGNGHGGDIRIQAKQLMLSGQNHNFQPTGIFSDTYNQGLGGNLFVQTESLDIDGNAAISARSYGLGDAGQINLQAEHLHMAQHATISTAAAQAGGGNIFLSGLFGLLYLDHSEITTSVTTGQGSGGNITIEYPQFTVLNQGLIKAQADEGKGGNIRIVAEQFLKSPDSLISASSRLGLDGDVQIDSPTIDLDAMLVVLPGGYVETQLKQCTQEEIDNPSTFKIDLTRKRTVPFFKLK